MIVKGRYFFNLEWAYIVHFETLVSQIFLQGFFIRSSNFLFFNFIIIFWSLSCSSWLFMRTTITGFYRLKLCIRFSYCSLKSAIKYSMSFTRYPSNFKCHKHSDYKIVHIIDTNIICFNIIFFTSALSWDWGKWI